MECCSGELRGQRNKKITKKTLIKVANWFLMFGESDLHQITPLSTKEKSSSTGQTSLDSSCNSGKSWHHRNFSG